MRTPFGSNNSLVTLSHEQSRGPVMSRQVSGPLKPQRQNPLTDLVNRTDSVHLQKQQGFDPACLLLPANEINSAAPRTAPATAAVLARAASSVLKRVVRLPFGRAVSDRLPMGQLTSAVQPEMPILGEVIAIFFYIVTTDSSNSSRSRLCPISTYICR